MISDYLMIPADFSGSGKIELLVADPYEGFHLLTQEDDELGRHYLDVAEFNQEEEREFEPVGKIHKFALNADQRLLAIYSNPDKGDLIVMKSDLSEELNRLRTGMEYAENLVWCGNDITALEFSDKIILVGPSNETIALDLDFPSTLGLKSLCEVDGLRIVNSKGTFFLERV